MTYTEQFFSQLEHPTGTIEFMDVQWTDEQGNICTSTDDIPTFNNFTSASDFEKHLVELYSLMCNEVNEKLKGSADTKYTKILYLETFQEKNKKLLKIIIAKQYESGIESYHHKNLDVKNISDLFEDQHQSNFHSFFKDYFILCTDYINKFQEFITKRIDHVTNLEDKDFSPQYKPLQKIKTNLSVADLSALYRILYDAKLIEADNKVDIGRFISDHFETKKAKEISSDSANNKFISPEGASLDFWYPKFLELRKIIDSLNK